MFLAGQRHRLVLEKQEGKSLNSTTQQQALRGNLALC